MNGRNRKSYASMISKRSPNPGVSKHRLSIYLVFFMPRSPGNRLSLGTEINKRPPNLGVSKAQSRVSTTICFSSCLASLGIPFSLYLGVECGVSTGVPGTLRLPKQEKEVGKTCGGGWVEQGAVLVRVNSSFRVLTKMSRNSFRRTISR